MEWPGASTIAAAAGGLIIQCLVRKPVERSSCSVLLELLIPISSIKPLKPGPELSPLSWGELLNRSLDSQNARHGPMLSGITAGRPTP